MSQLSSWSPELKVMDGDEKVGLETEATATGNSGTKFVSFEYLIVEKSVLRIAK